MIIPHALYRGLESTADQRQHAYRELFRMHLEPDELHAVREALNQELV